MSLLKYFSPKYMLAENVENKKEKVPRKIKDVSKIIEDEIEQYNKLDKWSIIRLLTNENNSIRYLELQPDYNHKKEDLLSKLFLTRIFADLIELTWDQNQLGINWRDLCFISLMESPSPDQIIREIIREIKRKTAFNNTVIIKNILQRKIRKSKLFLDLKNNKQNTLESYFAIRK